MAQKKRITDYEPGERIVGWVHDCRHCGARFVGHRDAIYCSDACRKRDSRMNAGRFWSKLVLQGKFEAGGGGFFDDPTELGEDKTERVDIIRTTPTCVLARTDSGTADVDAILRVQEEW
jgi:hypothetical protein